MQASVEVTDREAWLAERRSGIGASEASAALGLSPFATPLQLYMSKLGLIEDGGETEAMWWGSAMEGPLFERYEKETGRRIIRRQEFFRSPYRSHLFCTVDGINDRGHPVECKTISGWKAGELGDEGSDELPDHWLIQAYLQLWITDAGRVDFSVLPWGNSPRWRGFSVERTPRVESAIGAILPRLDEFWARVVDRDPPPPDLGADAGLIPLLHPEPDGSIALPEGAGEIIERLERARELRAYSERVAERARAELLLALGSAREGVLGDGRRVRRYDQSFEEKTITRKAYTTTTVKVLKARG